MMMVDGPLDSRITREGVVGPYEFWTFDGDASSDKDPDDVKSGDSAVGGD